MTDRDVSVTDPSAVADVLATPPTETLTAAPRTADVPSPSPSAELIPPRLADGLELIGEFADSGFKSPPFIARRSDGQVVQMPQMLFRLAEQIDGHAGYDELADRFSHAIQRGVTEDAVQMLVEQRLRPLGVVAAQDAGSASLHKVDPLLALKFRAALVPDGPVRSLTTVFRPLFFGPVMVLVLLAMVGIDGWLFFVHGISQGLRHTLYAPALMLAMIGGVVLATAFHEIGHATACRYGGARPGVMGVGIYIVWPAFYTDITDAYRLGKWGRLRADIGGMYFNAVFAVAVTAAYAATAYEPLLLLVVLQNVAIVQQALPVLRLDGYYILSDLTGVPDIFLRIRPILASLIPRRPVDPRVSELKPWVRAVTSAYVVGIVAFLTITALAMVLNLPRILATGYSSAADHFSAAGPALSHGSLATAVLDAVQGMFLILPAIGLILTLARVLQHATTAGARWSAGRPARQGTLGLAGAIGVLIAVLSWWPNGDYRPIQPGERGTVPGLLGQIAQLPSGRPSLSVARARQLGLGPGGSARAGARAGTQQTGAPAGSQSESLGARLRIDHRHSTPSSTAAPSPSPGGTTPSAGSLGAGGNGQTTTTGSSTTTATTSSSAGSPAAQTTATSTPSSSTTTTSSTTASSGTPTSASSATSPATTTTP